MFVVIVAVAVAEKCYQLICISRASRHSLARRQVCVCTYVYECQWIPIERETKNWVTETMSIMIMIFILMALRGKMHFRK